MTVLKIVADYAVWVVFLGKT